MEVTTTDLVFPAIGSRRGGRPLVELPLERSEKETDEDYDRRVKAAERLAGITIDCDLVARSLTIGWTAKIDAAFHSAALARTKADEGGASIEPASLALASVLREVAVSVVKDANVVVHGFAVASDGGSVMRSGDLRGDQLVDGLEAAGLLQEVARRVRALQNPTPLQKKDSVSPPATAPNSSA